MCKIFCISFTKWENSTRWRKKHTPFSLIRMQHINIYDRSVYALRCVVIQNNFFHSYYFHWFICIHEIGIFICCFFLVKLRISGMRVWINSNYAGDFTPERKKIVYYFCVICIFHFFSNFLNMDTFSILEPCHKSLRLSSSIHIGIKSKNKSHIFSYFICINLGKPRQSHINTGCSLKIWRWIKHEIRKIKYKANTLLASSYIETIYIIIDSLASLFTIKLNKNQQQRRQQQQQKRQQQKKIDKKK